MKVNRGFESLSLRQAEPRFNLGFLLGAERGIAEPLSKAKR